MYILRIITTSIDIDDKLVISLSVLVGTSVKYVDIPIVVTKTDVAGNVTSYELTAEMGKAPQKICVPITFKWCKEYKNIKDAYPGFKDWVTGGKFWNNGTNDELIYNE